MARAESPCGNLESAPLTARLEFDRRFAANHCRRLPIGTNSKGNSGRADPVFALLSRRRLDRGS